jgi:hypothetical protein
LPPGRYEQVQDPFIVTRSVAIVGDGADPPVEGGDADGPFRRRDQPLPVRPTVLLRGLQLTGGHDPCDRGGNVVDHGRLTLRRG